MTGLRNRDTKERFDEKWEAVTESGCWVWMFTTDGRYGSFHFPDFPKNYRMVKAHHAALFLYKGIIPEDGQVVMHKCDNTFCCNPDHLSIGTHQDNMTDMVNKGRSPKNMHKLTEDEIIAAKRLRSEGMQVKDIASIFGISPSQMSRVTQGSIRKFLRKAIETDFEEKLDTYS